MPAWLVSLATNELIIQAILGIIATVLLPRVFSFLKLKNDDKRREYLEKAMSGAIRAGINAYAKAQNKTPFAILLAVANDHTVREAITGFASLYLQNNAATAITKLKVGDRIEDIVTSRLDGVVDDMAQIFSNTAKSLERGLEGSPIPIETVGANYGNLGSEKPADPLVPPSEDNFELNEEHAAAAAVSLADELKSVLHKHGIKL